MNKSLLYNIYTTGFSVMASQSRIVMILGCVQAMLFERFVMPQMWYQKLTVPSVTGSFNVQGLLTVLLNMTAFTVTYHATAHRNKMSYKQV